ncbi:MAG: hypothetical protein FJ314_02400 [SAR202 cluster bacterium]|nr:hypothetical protein [SAR202 cluster bacterium]
MITTREKLLYAALWVADAAWLYVALAVFGLIVQIGGSPLSWPAVMGVLAGAMLVGWVAHGLKGETATLALLQGGVGLVVVYFVVAARSFDGFSGVQWYWVFELVNGRLSGASVATAIIAALAAILLWRRGIGLVTDDPASDRLRRTFRIGVMAIAVALIAQIATGRDIGAQHVLFPFFAAALAGMAFGQIAETTRRSAVGAWARVVALSVGIIMLLGVLLGLAGSAYGGGPLRLAGAGLGALRDGLLFLISIPLRWIVGGLFEFLRWLRSMFGGEMTPIQQPAAPLFGAPTPTAQTGEATGSGLVEAILNIIQYPVMMLLVLGILYLLVIVFRRVRKVDAGEETIDRESIRDQGNPRKDVASLLSRLLPGFARPKRTPEIWRYPLGQPGITEVFRLYFDYVSSAMRHGMELERHRTPAELGPLIMEALPGAPVALMTDRFNAACYGHEPTPPAMIAALEAGLEAAIQAAASAPLKHASTPPAADGSAR